MPSVELSDVVGVTQNSWWRYPKLFARVGGSMLAHGSGCWPSASVEAHSAKSDAISVSDIPAFRIFARAKVWLGNDIIRDTHLPALQRSKNSFENRILLKIGLCVSTSTTPQMGP